MPKRTLARAPVLLLSLSLALSVSVCGCAAAAVPEQAPAPVPAERVLSVYEGRLALFPSEQARQEGTPERVYETLVGTLPESEQKRLRDGIAVADEKMLAQLLEDYLS